MKDFLKKTYDEQLKIIDEILVNDKAHLFSICKNKDIHDISISTLDAILEYSFYTEDNPMRISEFTDIKICFQPSNYRQHNLHKHIVYFAHLVTQTSNDKRIHCKTKNESIKYWGLVLQSPEKIYKQSGKLNSFVFERKIKTNKANETTFAIL